MTNLIDANRLRLKIGLIMAESRRAIARCKNSAHVNIEVQSYIAQHRSVIDTCEIILEELESE